MTNAVRARHGYWPDCPCCEGRGRDWGETCAACGGTGRDSQCCTLCTEPAVGWNDDGEQLCEDCLFEGALDQQQ